MLVGIDLLDPALNNQDISVEVLLLTRDIIEPIHGWLSCLLLYFNL